MKAVIAGGGIGGLTAALALLDRGWQVQVFERLAEIAEIGAGVQISPNGSRILAQLGVLDALMPSAFAPEAIEMRTGRRGTSIFRLPLREAAVARWGAP